MRVIVATGLNAGAAEYQNLGDVAMLQAAVDRLLGLWPDARIEVLTDSPSNLARYCPGANALPRAGAECRGSDRVLLGQYHRFFPEWFSVRLSRLKRSFGTRWPRLLERVIRSRLSVRDGDGRRRDFERFVEALEHADLLAVCGSGGFADSCRAWNLSILGTMEAALAHGVPVVMLGQGMGPLSDPVVISRAKKVFPRIELITLRGNRGARELLNSLGVAPANVLTTGDEALEPAYASRARVLGRSVGINLRAASYSDVQSDTVAKVGAIVQAFARRHRTALLPIPIAVHAYAADHATIRQLLAGFEDESDGGLSLDTPQKLFGQTARCRVVMTGAYHAAVFALAQGIPVVCLSNSSYYLSKFEGLQDLFGNGCAIVDLSNPDWPDRLASAIESAWNSAEAVRLPLLQSAARQIEESRRAYRRVKDLLDSPQPGLLVAKSAQADRTESHLCRES